MTRKDANQDENDPRSEKGPKGWPKNEPKEWREPDGRFKKGGWPGGPGRPRKVILIEAVRKYADAEGKDLDFSTYEILSKIEQMAKEGDMTAARIWLDHICTQEAKEHIIQHMGPTVPTGQALNDWVNRLVQVSATDAGDDHNSN
jgi:hypothetical protein